MIAPSDRVPDFSLILACYNEEAILEQSVADIFCFLQALTYTSEVVFVDDASRDRTWAIIERIKASHPRLAITTLRHARNLGRGKTVTDGIRLARGRWVGFIDVDLEVDVRYVLPCLLALAQGYDVVSAKRIYKFHWRSVDRYLMSKGYSHLVRALLGVPLADTETGFKFFARDRIAAILDQCTDYGWFWDTEIMTHAYRAGLRIRETPALFVRRFDKSSSVRPLADSFDYLTKLWTFRRRLREGRSTVAPTAKRQEIAASDEPPASQMEPLNRSAGWQGKVRTVAIDRSG